MALIYNVPVQGCGDNTALLPRNHSVAGVVLTLSQALAFRLLYYVRKTIIGGGAAIGHDVMNVPSIKHSSAVLS